MLTNGSSRSVRRALAVAAGLASSRAELRPCRGRIGMEHHLGDDLRPPIGGAGCNIPVIERQCGFRAIMSANIACCVLLPCAVQTAPRLFGLASRHPIR